MKSCLRTLAITLVVAVATAAFGQTPFYLHPNDRVVFYGDSITEQYRYGSFVETFVLTRYPDLNARFINSGWSGDWVVGGGGGKIDQRIARDVVAEKATVATFMVGMNDPAYQDFDTSFFDVYSKGYEHLLDTLQQALPNLRITLFQPSPFDDVTRPVQYALRDGGYNKVIIRYGQFVRQLAQQHNLPVIDMNAPLVAVLEKAHQIDPALTEKIIPDRIHPAAAGGLVMATEILKAWHASPVVSSVEIDASKGRLTRSENGRVTDLQKKPALAWTQVDGALPLPLDLKDEVVTLVLRASDVVETLDQEVLKITALADAKYSLKIDGDIVGTFTRDELSRGVNLALLPTPMLKQALTVHDLTARRNSVRLARWQGVQVALQNETSPHLAEALSALDALDGEIVQQQKAAAVPVAHHFELVPPITP
jgi:lysophospholipase L1-like esterase